MAGVRNIIPIKSEEAQGVTPSNPALHSDRNSAALRSCR